MSVVHSYFGFSGRINRAKFWLLSILLVVFSVIAWIVALLAAFLITGLALTDGALPGLDEPGKLVQLILDYAVAFLVLFGVTIAIWVSYLAIGVKRLHDRDRSGWWIVVFYIVPWLLGSVVNVADKQGNDTVGLVAGLVGLVCVIWGLVELGFLRGTRGPNRFGPDPLQPELGLSAAPAASKPAA
jgi:uncharacterized membrane protein YhaH (DUF805 family)